MTEKEGSDLLGECVKHGEASLPCNEELIENQAKLSLALAVSKMAHWEGFLHGDVDDYFVFNDQFYALYRTNVEKEGGYKMSVKRYAERFVHPEDRWLVANEVSNLCDSDTKNEYFELEHRIICQDGEVRHVAVRYKVLRAKNGESIKTIGANQDITDQKRIEEKLKKARQQAESANRAKSVFLANMSHEIRTPMNGLLGTLQLLQQSGLNRDQDSYIETAIHSSKRLNCLLSDILDLSRVEAGKMKINSEEFSISDLLDAVLQLFEPMARAKGIVLRSEIDLNIPPSLMGDVVRLHQVVGNLIGNAIKFTSQGSVSIEAHLLPAFKESEIRVLFTVSDTGIGISDQVLNTLFIPFAQEERLKKMNSEGAGLGLSISKELIGLMKGEMAVASEEGVGSTFYICIPFGRGDHSSPTIVAEPRTCIPEGLKVLVAEDDRVSRMVATKFLENFHYHVDAVQNGEQVLDRLKEEFFDLVILDVQMPVLDGVETVCAIRRGHAGEDCKDVPVIAMTACVMAGDKQRFLEVGMNGYVEKPVDIAMLREELARIF